MENKNTRRDGLQAQRRRPLMPRIQDPYTGIRQSPFGVRPSGRTSTGSECGLQAVLPPVRSAAFRPCFHRFGVRPSGRASTGSECGLQAVLPPVRSSACRPPLHAQPYGLTCVLQTANIQELQNGLAADNGPGGRVAQSADAIGLRTRCVDSRSRVRRRPGHSTGLPSSVQ